MPIRDGRSLPSPSALASLLLATVLCVLLALPATAGAVCGEGAGADCARASGHEADADEGEEESEEAESEAGEGPEAEAGEEGSQAGETAGAGRAKRRSSHLRANHDAASVSRLALTAKSRAALNRSSPLASAIGFSFTLSVHAKLRVTLYVQRIAHGRIAWLALASDTLTLSSGKGRGSHSLTGRNRLAPGAYRLTLTPVGGVPRSLYLTVGR
jgi:hypothetical protein